MAATFYVPVERKSLPASDPLRWMILPIETTTPTDAMRHATTIAVEEMGLKNTAIWAAVRDIPSFTYLQELRDSMGRYSKRGAKKIAGYA